MLHFCLAKHAIILSRNGKTNKEMFIYVIEGMYFIQSFSIQPCLLAYVLQTMQREVEEEIKHIAVQRQQRFQVTGTGEDTGTGTNPGAGGDIGTRTDPGTGTISTIANCIYR